MVLNLLGFCSTIRRLKVTISQVGGKEACPPNCPCDQPQNWRSQNISLMVLEDVEIEGFNGTGHEVGFFKLLSRCATLMKRRTVRLAPEVLTSNRGCKEIYRICKANPDVKCSVYDRYRKRQVLYCQMLLGVRRDDILKLYLVKT